MNKNFKLVCLAALGLLLGSCTIGERVAGNGTASETQNTIAGRVVEPDGDPVHGARVSLRSVDYLSPLPKSALVKTFISILNTTTDDTGGFSFDSVDAGRYFIEVDSGKSLATLFEIDVKKDYAPLQLNTRVLEKPATINGNIALPPVIKFAYVQVRGLERLVLVDTVTGAYQVKVPPGTYTIRLLVSDYGIPPVDSSDIGLHSGDSVYLPPILVFDTIAPVVTVNTLDTNDATPPLSGTIDDTTATIIIDVGGQTELEAVNRGDGTWVLPDNTLDSLADGTYDIRVTATDTVGNVGNDTSGSELTITALGPYHKWETSVKLHIDTTSLKPGDFSQDVHDFPMLLRLYPSKENSDAVFQYSKADGSDIRFTKADSITPLNNEIERWDSAAGLAEVWITVDTVFANVDSQHIIMHMGNPAAQDISDGAAVFAGGYDGVWHMSQTPSPAPGALKDATGSGYDGAFNGAMNADDWVEGYIGHGIDFDGNDDYIDLGGKQNNPGKMTMSAWVKFNGIIGEYAEICSKEYVQGFSLSRVTDFTAKLHGNVGDGTSWGAGVNSDRTLEAGTWYHLAAVYDGGVVTLFVNGVMEASEDLMITPPSSDDAVRSIGSNANKDRFFNGIIDELRMSNTIRSADWIKLLYQDQIPDSTFQSL